MANKVYNLPRYTTTADGIEYIVVAEAHPHSTDPRISLLSEDFSHYTNIRPHEYSTDIHKARIGDILKCYHDDDNLIRGLHIKTGNSFVSRDNLFQYFDNALNELIRIHRTKDYAKQYNLKKSLTILSECIIQNSQSFSTTRDDVFSYDNYCAQLNRIDYFTTKLLKSTDVAHTRDYLANLFTITDKTNYIYTNANKHSDLCDIRKSRDASPVSSTPAPIQTSLDNFIASPIRK